MNKKFLAQSKLSSFQLYLHTLGKQETQTQAEEYCSADLVAKNRSIGDELPQHIPGYSIIDTSNNDKNYNRFNG